MNTELERMVDVKIALSYPRVDHFFRVIPEKSLNNDSSSRYVWNGSDAKKISVVSI
jgi:hypothetical protein